MIILIYENWLPVVCHAEQSIFDPIVLFRPSLRVGSKEIPSSTSMGCISYQGLSAVVY